MRTNEILRVSLSIVTPNLSGSLKEKNRRKLGNFNRVTTKETPSFREVFEKIQNANYIGKR